MSNGTAKPVPKGPALTAAIAALAEPGVNELVLPAAAWKALADELLAYFKRKKTPEEIAATRLVIFPGHEAHRFPGRGQFFKLKGCPVFMAETSNLGV